MNELLKILTLVSVGNIYCNNVKALPRKSNISTFFTNNNVKILSTATILGIGTIAGLLYDRYKYIYGLSYAIDKIPALTMYELQEPCILNLCNSHQGQIEIFDKLKQTDEVTKINTRFALQNSNRRIKKSLRNHLAYIFYSDLYFANEQAQPKPVEIDSRFKNHIRSKYVKCDNKIIEYQYVHELQYSYPTTEIDRKLLNTSATHISHPLLEISYLNNTDLDEIDDDTYVPHRLSININNALLVQHINTDVFDDLLMAATRQISHCSKFIKNKNPVTVTIRSDNTQMADQLKRWIETLDDIQGSLITITNI